MTSLPYSTCVALRDAGFPQEIKDYPIWENIYYNDNRTLVVAVFKENRLDDWKNPIKCPTTDELIEKLGEEGMQMTHDEIMKEWSVTKHDTTAEGKTLKDALAALYLALKGKK